VHYGNLATSKDITSDVFTAWGTGTVAHRPTHFWLRVHQLAEAFEDRGATDQDRANVILAELREMPPELQEQSLQRLALMGQIGSAVAAAFRLRVS
jgi:hypothetical protein